MTQVEDKLVTLNYYSLKATYYLLPAYMPATYKLM